ncbi:MAG: hypothetical protein F6K17_05415 [Okeania sp. SIO3C4]|nr:hypothetical protein [Okeania sp. SIO3B3]NER02109.1 hypothetical protein [Okeania sp. SIO3C4]
MFTTITAILTRDFNFSYYFPFLSLYHVRKKEEGRGKREEGGRLLSKKKT